MKKGIKNQKGVTLIILVITIIIIAILAGAAIRKVDTGKDVRAYNYMCADIELLKNKILVYYNETGSVPTKGLALAAKEKLGNQASSRDGDKYYSIDLSQLYNVTLNYGGGTLGNGDIYIVNTQSLEVYYWGGVEYEGVRYYTKKQ